jgi:hypothetical protein
VKDAGFLKAWRVKDPSQQLILQTDFAALEPHVLTELSHCKAMLGLYGPDAPKGNDVYIYCAALCGGDLGQPFIELGYVPLKPTKETIETCKKQLKHIRNAAKIVVLSDDYGSGVEKKWRTLRLQGFKFSMDQMRDIQARLDAAFIGKKQFGEKLKRELEMNRGFVLDAFGLPTPIWREKSKDATNRCLAEGTLVRVKDGGWKRIESLDTNDWIWDTDTWVRHGGLIYNGLRNTISVDGLRCTPDHLIMADTGEWIHAEKINTISKGTNSAQQINSLHTKRAAYSWADCWKLGCSIFRAALGKK